MNLDRRPPVPATSAGRSGTGKAPPPTSRPRKARLPRAGTVVFDCDSTLSAVEGIDVLAHAHRDEIERLTNAAMDGSVPLEEVYARRLSLVRPTRAQVDALARRYIEALVPDARATVDALRAEGIVVRVMSGGLLPAVRPLAAALGIGPADVAAVDVRFDDDGAFAGFDDGSPLARAGGKADVLARWRSDAPGPILLVGDGATDLEARDVVDVFVAFAGVVARPAVVAAADAVVHARSLAPIVPLALGGRPPAEPAARAVYERGLALLDEAALASLDLTFTKNRK